MAISTHPMNDQSGKLIAKQAESTKAGHFEARRDAIRQHGTDEQKQRADQIDRASERLQRIVDKRIDRTTAQRERSEIVKDDIKRQPTPTLGPTFDSGNRTTAVPMTQAEKDRSEDRAVHNVDLRNSAEKQQAAALIDALRQKKMEPIAQAVEHAQRNKDGPKREPPKARTGPSVREAFQGRAAPSRKPPNGQQRDIGLGD